MHEVGLYPHKSEAAVGATASLPTPCWQKRSPVPIDPKPVGNTMGASAVRVAVEPDGVPAELKSYDHWVVWEAVPKETGEGFDKVPYSPHSGRRASTRDSRTWASFDATVAAYVKDGWDGIGFVFSSGDPFTGIDLDNVRDPRTGEIEPWARKVAQVFDSYTEVSPSGTGLHIYVVGDAPSHKSERIEVYCEKRFFAATGVRV